MSDANAVDLEYDLASLCGPVDMRVVDFLEMYRGHRFDTAYLDHVRRWHGGVPGKQYFPVSDGTAARVGRFLTLVDRDTELEPPHRHSWENPERDMRIDWSVLTLIAQEGASCRNLFDGERLIPFAALYCGPHHPDGMSLTDGNVDLLCFDFAPHGQGAKVVLWLAHAAQREYFRWDDALATNDDEPVRYEDFTIPVASNFDSFLRLLRSTP